MTGFWHIQFFLKGHNEFRIPHGFQWWGHLPEYEPYEHPGSTDAASSHKRKRNIRWITERLSVSPALRVFCPFKTAYPLLFLNAFPAHISWARTKDFWNPQRLRYTGCPFRCKERVYRRHIRRKLRNHAGDVSLPPQNKALVFFIRYAVDHDDSGCHHLFSLPFAD